jgi:alpha-D-ribose 1-methylphosphonate 5-triphosphate synthase subunit PhnL
VLIDGVDVNMLGDSGVARVRGEKLGFIFQQYNLIPTLTAQENVELSMRIMGKSKPESREHAKELLKEVGLAERLNNKPSQLSGGEQQRVNIARSFIRRYPVLLLDEPTASLDAENRAIVVQLIRDALAEGAAMIGIFHDEDVRDAVATRLFPVLAYKAAA